MRKTFPFIVVFAIVFLFLIQMAGTLIESIYILDLMHLSLDEKVLCALFFFAPVFLLFFRKKVPALLVWVTFGLLFLARGVTPSLDTQGRLLASGLATGSALILLALLLSAKPKGSPYPRAGLYLSAGLALAVSSSVLLRTLDYSLDVSLLPGGAWVGWVLGLLLGASLTQLDWQTEPSVPVQKGSSTAALLGLFLILTLIYFAFSAPDVIARWTNASYALIITAVSLLSAGWVWFTMSQPRLIEKLSRVWVVIWNSAFTLSLVATILVQRVSFPQTVDGTLVQVASASPFQFIPLVFMLLLFPVLFVDLRLFADQIRQRNPTPARLVPGMLLGSLALLVLIFINTFTNVWGYIPPVSPFFRNLFWLPFLLSAGALTLLIAIRGQGEAPVAETPGKVSWGWAAGLAVIFLTSAGASLRTAPQPPVAAAPSSLLVMTYNIQAGNDGAGEVSYERQLALIRQVSPDVVALQESDTARVGLNNKDVVRYFANSLGYYSYYGPTTVTGTFGTAILSKYPLLNPAVIFSYSDTDEIGTTQAEIEVAGRRITLYDVHPDGSDTAKMAFARALAAQARDKTNAIALGDFNLQPNDPAYQLFAGVYHEAWSDVYPSGVAPDGTDMSERIDHIFMSPDLSARKPTYLLPPASASDHPAHWAEVFWKN